MLDRFDGVSFRWEVVVALFLGVVIALLVYFVTWRVPKERILHVGFLRDPANTTLTIAGLLVPILSGIASYLYANYPAARFPSLIAAVVVTLFAMGAALWTNFSLLSLADDSGGTEVLTFKEGKSRHFIVFRGCMFVWLGLALAYTSFGLLTEVPSKAQPQKVIVVEDVKPLPTAFIGYFLAKPPMQLDRKKTEVLRAWGAPSRIDTEMHRLLFDSQDAVLSLRFDAADRLVEFTATKSKP